MDLPATINIFLLHLHLESWAAASNVEAFFGPSNDPTWKPSSAVETAAKRPSKGPSCIKLSKVEKGSLRTGLLEFKEHQTPHRESMALANLT